MKRILFPTDFSECATNAFNCALRLAKATDAQLHVLHVLFPNEGIDNHLYNTYWADDYLEQREKSLDHWIREEARKVEVPMTQIALHCTVGFPVAAICTLAEETQSDLIVMGTTGSTGLKGVFLGSVAAGVLHKTRIPALAIPDGTPFPIAGDAVFATDFRFNADDHSLDVLNALLRYQKGRLHAVHVLDKPGKKEDPIRENSLRSKLEDNTVDFHYLHDQDIAQAISNFIESIDAGLLVAVAHDHSILHTIFHDSITRKLAYHTRVPLLVFHEPKKEL
ncbi:MAG: universal stress protein [Saprospiraceae bacterium]